MPRGGQVPQTGVGPVRQRKPPDGAPGRTLQPLTLADHVPAVALSEDDRAVMDRRGPADVLNTHVHLRFWPVQLRLSGEKVGVWNVTASARSSARMALPSAQ